MAMGLLCSLIHYGGSRSFDDYLLQEKEMAMKVTGYLYLGLVVEQNSISFS
jgi:hypothetical protein